MNCTNGPPLVSIGMPVRNGQEFVEETLNSLLMQTFRNFEIIISDNASEDNTASICQHYALSDNRIRYSRFNKNVGAAENYNHVFGLSIGRYFKWAAHDDICLPNYLEKCIETFDVSPISVVLVYPKTDFIDAHGRYLKSDKIFLGIHEASPSRRLAHFISTIHYANPVFGLIRSSALQKTRLIGKFIKSDLVLLAELLMLGEFREVPEVLFKRRLHEERSITANKSKESLHRWFNPSQGKTLDLLPVDLRVRLEYIRSSCRIPVRYSDRLRCLSVVARTRVIQELRNIGGLYKHHVEEWLGVSHKVRDLDE